MLNCNGNEINIQLLCSRALASGWEFWPRQTYVCGYCKGSRGFSFKALLQRNITELFTDWGEHLPGKLQNVQQLVAHLLSPLKQTINCEFLTVQKAALSAIKHTGLHVQLRLWLNPAFSQWKQSRVLWPLWPALLHLAKTPDRWSGFPLSLGPPCDTPPSSSGTRRFEGM